MRFSLPTNHDCKQGHHAIHAQVSAFPRRRRCDEHVYHSARVSSSSRSRGAGAFSPLASARPISLSALSAARVRLCVGTGSIRSLRKHEHQVVSKFFADLNHAASPTSFDGALNTLIKAGVAGNEVPNFR